MGCGASKNAGEVAAAPAPTAILVAAEPSTKTAEEAPNKAPATTNAMELELAALSSARAGLTELTVKQFMVVKAWPPKRVHHDMRAALLGMMYFLALAGTDASVCEVVKTMVSSMERQHVLRVKACMQDKEAKQRAQQEAAFARANGEGEDQDSGGSEDLDCCAEDFDESDDEDRDPSDMYGRGGVVNDRPYILEHLHIVQYMITGFPDLDFEIGKKPDGTPIVSDELFEKLAANPVAKSDRPVHHTLPDASRAMATWIQEVYRWEAKKRAGSEVDYSTA